jgi:hypothetical protein
LTFINKLTNKSQAFKKVSNRDFFVNYYHTYKEYQIILFLDMNEFSFKKTKKIFNELELYLTENQADKIIFIPKKYKKYFSQEIRKSYFGYFEKNKIFKENEIQDLEVLNSGMFGSFLPHLTLPRFVGHRVKIYNIIRRCPKWEKEELIQKNSKEMLLNTV